MCGAINVPPIHLHGCTDTLQKFLQQQILCWVGCSMFIGVRSICNKVIQKRNTLIHQFLKSDGLNFGGSYIIYV